ncbi:MAG: hypothetical protein IT445_20665 [Phycisphaeraceae bacterium]|nr:hypothetical protein [Phycisphaeraceae bacterium]
MTTSATDIFPDPYENRCACPCREPARLPQSNTGGTSVGGWMALVLLLTMQIPAAASTVWRVDFTLTVERVFEPGYPLPPGSYDRPVVGEQYFGGFLYNDRDLTGVGVEALTSDDLKSLFPADAPGRFGLLDVWLDYHHQQLTEADALQYPWGPDLWFEDGSISGLVFAANADQGDVDISLDLFGIYLLNAETYTGRLAEGLVTYGDPVAIHMPTPSTGIAASVLLCVLGLKRRRRAA